MQQLSFHLFLLTHSTSILRHTIISNNLSKRIIVVFGSFVTFNRNFNNFLIYLVWNWPAKHFSRDRKQFLIKMQLFTNKNKTLNFSFFPEFNERMDQLMNSQFDAWAGFCSQPGTYQFNNSLPYIKSMYLMADRGVKR